jgi:hypothetical protein
MMIGKSQTTRERLKTKGNSSAHKGNKRDKETFVFDLAGKKWVNRWRANGLVIKRDKETFVFDVAGKKWVNQWRANSLVLKMKLVAPRIHLSLKKQKMSFPMFLSSCGPSSVRST